MKNVSASVKCRIYGLWFTHGNDLEFFSISIMEKVTEFRNWSKYYIYVQFFFSVSESQKEID